MLLTWANEPAYLWHRYDALMRKSADLTTPEKQELAELRALLVEAGIVVESDAF